MHLCALNEETYFNNRKKFQDQIFPSYSVWNSVCRSTYRHWSGIDTTFINLKQHKTEVLFFSHFTLCCLSDEFFYGLLWINTTFINLKQHNTEVLFFSNFTLCCLSNEFFSGLLWARATGTTINSIDSTTSCQKTISFTNHQLHTKQGCVIFKLTVPLYKEKFDY